MLRRSLIAAPLALAAAPARADWAPKQPIKILVGYAPGGTADIAARIAADTIQRQHGYTVVVDNKTGAGGFIALKAVAQSAPDGYTVGIGIMGQLSVGPVVPGSQIPLDLDKELVPICNLVGVPMALIVRIDAPFKTIPELVTYAKANPGKVSYASTGLGSTNQLGAEFLAAEAGGLKMIHVPYRGGAPAIADVAAGQVDLFFGNVSELIGQARARCVCWRSPPPSPRRWRRSCRCSQRTFPHSTSTTGSALWGLPACPLRSRDRWPKCFSMRWQIRRIRKRSPSKASSHSARALTHSPPTFRRTANAGRRW